MTGTQSNKSFETLLEYLRANRGFDFTGYKRPSLMRRVTKRMHLVNIEDFSDYVDYLEVHPEEFAQLFNTILINVTAFFRDQEAWDHLAREIVPRILESKKEAEPIRVWSAGCASGEEAFSLAIVFAEAIGEAEFLARVKIYATDVDEDALSQARHASYSASDLAPLPAALRERYFHAAASRFVFRTALRRGVIFGRHDLVQDAPISRLDLLVCRNTLMYFNAEAQARILDRFHFALKDHGHIFLGRAELLVAHSNQFTPISVKQRTFTKASGATLRDRPIPIAPASANSEANNTARHVRLREQSFDISPVAQLVVDLNGMLLLANQRSRHLFGLTARDLGRALQDLEVSYRPADLRSLIDNAYAERRNMKLSNIERTQPDGQVRYFDVHAVPLHDDGGANLGAAILFDDVTAAYLLNQDLSRTKHEVETAYEELQSTNEELETTNEELQSTVEELETTNEELQSTNEEMETMNEELQATNEELRTLNDQLEGRTSELNDTNAFLQSVFKSMRDALVVVDRNMDVQVWNWRAEDLWGLRADEVVGHSFPSLDIGLPVAQLTAPIRACLAGQNEPFEHVFPATNRRGKSMQCRISCNPHNSPDENGRGAILVMEEVE